MATGAALDGALLAEPGAGAGGAAVETGGAAREQPPTTSSDPSAIRIAVPRMTPG
jgi:hypothetical protein